MTEISTELVMENMNYSGLQYSTTLAGTYTTKFPNALTHIGKHTFGVVKRDERLELMDDYMLEAYNHYPHGYDMSALDGWSRSYYTREEHIKSVTNMAKGIRFPRPIDSSMKQTVLYCQELFLPLPKVKSLCFHTDLHLVPFENTSSAGIGMIGKKGADGNHQKAISQAFATVKRCKREGIQIVIEQSTPDAALTRTQLTKLSEKLKIRNVFGQAFQYILIEGLTASPLIEMFCREDTFLFIGKDPRVAVPTLLQDFTRKGGKLMTFDWSSFDTSVEPWEIIDAFDLLETLIEFPDDESRLAFEFSKIFFINRKTAAPNGKVYFKQRSVPSGSYYTLIIDAIVNLRRIIYLSFKAYGRVPRAISVQGDDAAGAFDADFTASGLWLVIPPNSDWVLNKDKCDEHESGSQVQYLQRSLKWGDQARDIAKVERLAIYPEFPVDDPQISGYRARALWTDCNYESKILGFATLYLEDKYGKPESVPKEHLHWWEVIFSAKK